MIGFGRMVVDYVYNDFDVVLVQGVHHPAEFSQRRFLIGRIGQMRAEKTQSHVPPVIVFLGIKLVNWHQLDHRDAEFFQLGNFLNNAGKGTGMIRSNATGGAFGKSANMQLIDNCVGVVANHFRSVATV